MWKTILLLCLTLKFTYSGIVRKRQENMVCGEIPEIALEELLGPSYNPRYMSIAKPSEEEKPRGSLKRTAFSDPDFFVDDDHFQELAEDPAWEVTNHVSMAYGIGITSKARRYRGKRSAQGALLEEWHCQSKIVWKDLGPDYFPRYLRTVECSSSNCWFGMYHCKPRSFTVKLLRKRHNKCVLANPGTKIGTTNLPRDLQELWVWEERAVNFCCDCTT